MRSEVASFADVVRLADLVDDGVLVINDGYRAKNAELGSEGLPFVRAGNVRNGFDFADADILMPAR